mgnify:CR=1 FL=1
MKTIGIVACSAEGAALCYRTICTEGPAMFGPHAHPPVVMHTPPLSDYVACIERDDWLGVGRLMLASAGVLAGAGADFLICPDNTIHQALPQIRPRSPRPWLHIAEAVADAAAAAGHRRIGLTGTQWLVESDVYPDALRARGLTCIRPPAAVRAEMNRRIMDELVYGVFKPETADFFQDVIRELADAGADAAVLGCTEIPRVVPDGSAAIPTFDSTRLLARAALQEAA